MCLLGFLNAENKHWLVTCVICSRQILVLVSPRRFPSSFLKIVPPEKCTRFLRFPKMSSFKLLLLSCVCVCRYFFVNVLILAPSCFGAVFSKSKLV